jgi:class 3 adenylate cyclase
MLGAGAPPYVWESIPHGEGVNVAAVVVVLALLAGAVLISYLLLRRQLGRDALAPEAGQYLAKARQEPVRVP